MSMIKPAPDNCPFLEELSRTDPEIFGVVEREWQRQMSQLELIASENFVSPAVRAAQGSVLTHKYAEGYPGRRYYGGCENVDTAEDLAIQRAKQLFDAEHANVQPHSGTQANMAVYFGFLKPGDTIMGMDLSHGGHLSHGAPVTFSGKLYKAVTYGVDRNTEQVDFDVLAQLARNHRPKLGWIGTPSRWISTFWPNWPGITARSLSLPGPALIRGFWSLPVLRR